MTKQIVASAKNLGIVVHTNTDTRAIRGHDWVTGLEFKDGKRLACDLVVIAAGIKANSGLALRAGLAVERGIIVDNQLCTDDPRIFAVGECVQHRGQVYGLVAPLWEQAKVLATGLSPRTLKSMAKRLWLWLSGEVPADAAHARGEIAATACMAWLLAGHF